MTDFREYFAVDPDTTRSIELAILRLTEQPRIIMMFSSDCVAVATHYLDSGTFRGYVQCNQPIEGQCLLCTTSRTHENRIVMPVYDVELDAVAALLISDARSPHSLGPQVRAVLDAGQLDERFVLISRRFAKYEVTTMPVPSDAETGELAIASFLEHSKNGQLLLENVIPTLSNRQLAEIPEIGRKAAALGIKVDGCRSLDNTFAATANE